MSKAGRFHFDKFTQDLQMPTAPKRGGVHPSRLVDREVYSVKVKKSGGNKRDWRRVLIRGQSNHSERAKWNTSQGEKK